MRLRNPFNPERFPGKAGLLTTQETSRLEDLIKSAIDDIARQLLVVPVTADPGAIVVAPSSLARYWLSEANATLPNGVDMSALGAGILQQTVAADVSTPTAFLGTQGSVLFLGASGALAQNNGNLFWNNSALALGIGTGAPDTGSATVATRLHLVGNVAEVTGTGGIVRQIIRNTSDTGAALLLLMNDEGLQDSTPYAGGSAAIYYTGTQWAGSEGANKLVLMAPNPGVVTGAEMIFGISGQRKVILSWIDSASSSLEVTNPDEASSGGVSQLVLDQNQPGVQARIILGGHTHDDIPDTLLISHMGGKIIVAIDGDTWVEVAQTTGVVSLASLAAGGYVKASNPDGDLSVVSAIPVADVTGAVASTRAINTTAPITGGGDLSADRTIAITDFVGSGASHARGAVPDPGAVAGTVKFLREDATWATPAGSGGTVTTVTATAPLFITSTPTTTPNVTIQGAIVSGSTSTSAQNLGALTTGLLKGTVAAGVSTISPAVAGTDYQAPVTWPALGRVLVSNGTTNDPVGFNGFEYDDGADQVVFANSVPIALYNLGNRTANTDYERLLIDRTANVYTLTSEQKGTGVIRAIRIGSDAGLIIAPDTAQSWFKAEGTDYESVRAEFISTYTYGSNFWVVQAQSGGAGAQQNIAIDALAGAAVVAGDVVAGLFSGDSTISASNVAGAEQNVYHSQFTRASSAPMVYDGHRFNSNLFIGGSTNITTALGVNAVVVRAPVYDGLGSGKTISSAASLVVAGPPTGTNGVTITTGYGLWVQGGLTEFSGDAILCGNGQKAGFFGSIGTTKQTPAGSRAGNAALASLLTALAAYGIITDGTSA